MEVGEGERRELEEGEVVEEEEEEVKCLFGVCVSNKNAK